MCSDSCYGFVAGVVDAGFVVVAADGYVVDSAAFVVSGSDSVVVDAVAEID